MFTCICKVLIFLSVRLVVFLFFSMVAGPIRLIVLDSNLDPDQMPRPRPFGLSSRRSHHAPAQGQGHGQAGGEDDEWDSQTHWLFAELQSAEYRSAAFRVVVVHVPPFVEFWNANDFWNKGTAAQNPHNYTHACFPPLRHCMSCPMGRRFTARSLSRERHCLWGGGLLHVRVRRSKVSPYACAICIRVIRV